MEWYWWPFMGHDIAWYAQTYYICQTRQTQQVAISPVIATSAPLFTRMYMDTMHIMHSGRYSYIVQGQCLLTGYPEFQMLCKESAQVLTDWIFQDILCWWSTLNKIVLDNGSVMIPPMVGPTWSRAADIIRIGLSSSLSQRTCLILHVLVVMCHPVCFRWLCVMCPSSLPLPAYLPIR